MRLFFLGSGAFGLPTLRHLAAHAGHTLCGVLTQPDRPAGRGKTLSATPIGEWAATNLPGVPLIKAENVNEPGLLARVRAEFGPGGTAAVEAWIVIAFGQKLSPALLEGVRAVNLHASLLPRWRGAAPINAAMLAGDAQTGNSVITLAQRMDAGLILGQSTRMIEPQHTAGELHDLLAGDGPALMESVLSDMAAGTGAGSAGVVQDEALATKAPKLSRADAWVDFTQDAQVCRQRIHGLTPWPGIAAKVGSHDVKLLRVASDEHGVGASMPGAAGAIVDAQGGTIRCGGGSSLRMLEVQPAGGRAMPWSAFVAGRRVAAGEVVSAGRPVC
ncbi:MAG: methionyl-tRNA formyltransferase [Phycisphaerales bacterium]